MTGGASYCEWMYALGKPSVAKAINYNLRAAKKVGKEKRRKKTWLWLRRAREAGPKEEGGCLWEPYLATAVLNSPVVSTEVR